MSIEKKLFWFFVSFVRTFLDFLSEIQHSNPGRTVKWNL